MAVVTISREVGSYGSRIAEKVAQVLGYHFVGKLAIEQMLYAYGIEKFHEHYHSTPAFWDRFSERGAERDRMLATMKAFTLSLARHGDVVIMGRGCYASLAGFDDVLNVRVQASTPTRLKRLMEKEHIEDAEKAEALLKERDEVRSSFVRSCYGLELNEAEHFDLVVDTTKISVDMATRWIIEAVQGLGEPADGTGRRVSDSLKPDLWLDGFVSSFLSRNGSQ